jgi:hypothetical protein
MTEEQRLVLDALHRLRLSRLAELVALEAKPPVRLALDRLLIDVAARLRDASATLAADYFADLRGPRQLLNDEEDAA